MSTGATPAECERCGRPTLMATDEGDPNPIALPCPCEWSLGPDEAELALRREVRACLQEDQDKGERKGSKGSAGGGRKPGSRVSRHRPSVRGTW